MPAGLADLVLRRVGRLGDPANELLEAAAVLGQKFELSAIEKMIGWSSDETEKLIDLVIRNELLYESAAPSDSIEFNHAIVREAVYNRLTRIRRVALHRRAGAALEYLASTGAPVATTAIAHHHAEAATATTVDIAMMWCRRAARDAATRLAYAESGGWLDRAIALADEFGHEDSPQREGLLLERAIASQAAYERGTRTRFLRAAADARARDDTRTLVKAALGFDRGFFAQLGQVDEERVRLLEEALVLTDDLAERACLTALLASELTWDDPGGDRFARADVALDMARRSDDSRALVRVLSLRPPTIWCPQHLPELEATIEELGDVLATSDDPLLRSRYLTYKFGIDAEAGRFTNLASIVDQGSDLAAYLQLPDLMWQAGLQRANFALLRGNLDEARREATESLEVTKGAHPFETLLFYAAIEFEVRRLRGGLDEVAPQLESWRARPADGGYSATKLLYDAGRANQAREDYSAGVRLPFTMPTSIQGGITAINLAYLAARFEDIATAAHLFDVLAPYSDRFFHAIRSNHVTSHYCGMLATTLRRFDEAAALFRHAVATHDAAGAPLLAAESRIEWARLSMFDGQWDGPRPTDLVDSAIGAAELAGADAVVARARELRSRL
jgi:hypothetical protein